MAAPARPGAPSDVPTRPDVRSTGAVALALLAALAVAAGVLGPAGTAVGASTATATAPVTAASASGAVPTDTAGAGLAPSGALSSAATGAATAVADLGGYWVVDERGHVHAFGEARHVGEGSWGTVAVAAPPSGAGYWLVTRRGVVVPRGAVADLGGAPPLAVGERVVGITATPSGRGAWLFTDRGRVHGRGDAAAALGDAGGLPLNRPVVGGVATATGRGYWLVAADGGVFAYGDAAFHGSMGGRPLNAPVVSLVPTPTGRGYWLVASDGGVFAFGDAAFRGSMGGVALNRPVQGMVAAGDGYLMVASDGGVFAFGDRVPFHGSLGGAPPPDDVVAIAPVAAGRSGALGADLPFRATIDAVDPSRLHASWRAGCPVGPEQLRLVTADHWDFAGRLRSGELVVHRDVAAAVVQVLRQLHAARFPVQSMELVDRFGGDDGRSMAANNSSAFNCRAVTGGTAWSEHSYGRAIDLNPVQNPYVRGATVLPAAGRAHLGRDAGTPGLIRNGDAVVRAFAGIGWSWGGTWSNPDYQHFSATGR